MNIYLITNDDGVSHETYSLQPFVMDLKSRIENAVRGNNSGVKILIEIMDSDDRTVSYTIQDAGDDDSPG